MRHKQNTTKEPAMRLSISLLIGATLLLSTMAAVAYVPNYRWSFVSTPILSGRVNDTSTDYDTSPTLARLQYDGTTDAAASSGVWQYFFEADTDNEIHIHATLPNQWVGPVGRPVHRIYPAIRWAPNTADSGTDGVADNVVIGFEYAITDKDAAYGTTTTLTRTVPAGTTAKKGWLTDFPSSGGVLTTADIGASFPIRVFRDADNAADTYTDTIAIIDFVLYIEQEPATAGSRQRQTR